MIKFQKHYAARKAIALVTAGAFVVTTAVPLGAVQPAEAESMSADGYVTAAASRAAQTAPEILGLTGVEETSGSTGAAGWGSLNWATPKYNIFGQQSINTAANPYMVNAVAVESGTDPDATPTIVLNTSREGGGRGPSGALATYGTDSTDDAVWDTQPDVVIGTGTRSGAANYDSASYIGEKLYASGYHPKGVAYYSGENANIIKEMYAIAKAADEVVDESNGAKKLRYGNATTIAKNYEAYVRGTQGLILKAIDNGAKKQIVAVVNDYDEDSKTYTLTKPNATLTGAAAGTSETDHYLDMVNVVTDNLADTLDTTTVTADQLATADAIIVGGNSVESASVAATIPSNLLSKTYWTSDYNAGAIYDVMHNAVDNIQNAGRILGFVYPTVIDQDDWVCYYYDNFYHVKSDRLAYTIDKAMDGVRNQDATSAANYLQWDTADASTYNEASVQEKLDEGAAYYGTKVTSGVDALTENITDWYAAETTIDFVAQLKANANPTQADIDQVTEAYNKLSDEQKAMVTDYDTVIKEAQAKVDAAKNATNNTTKATTGVAKGKTAKASGQSYKVTSNGTGSKATVTFTKAANKKSVTVPATVKLNGKAYKVTTVAAKAFAQAKKATKVTIGKNVTKLAKNAFKGSKVKTVTLKTTKLTKKSVKGSLKSSKVKTIKAPSKKVKAYKKIFTKANAGKKATVKKA